MMMHERLDGDGWRPFSGLSRDIWLGSSQGSGWHLKDTHTELSLSHFSVVLVLCLESCSCWKVNLRPSVRSGALWTRFSLRTSLYFAQFSFPSTQTSRLSLPLKNTPTVWCYCHHASLLGWYWAGDERCCWDGIGQVMGGAVGMVLGRGWAVLSGWYWAGDERCLISSRYEA